MQWQLQANGIQEETWNEEGANEHLKFMSHLVEGREICEVVIEPLPDQFSFMVEVESNKNVMYVLAILQNFIL